MEDEFTHKFGLDYRITFSGGTFHLFSSILDEFEAICTAYVAHMDGSSGTALLLWDNRYRTDKNSSVKLSRIIVLNTDLLNRVVVEIERNNKHTGNRNR